MYVVESTFTGKNKRNRHSWLTCVTPSRQRALEQIDRLQQQSPEHRLVEVVGRSFPVYAVGGSLDYRLVDADGLARKLLGHREGAPDTILFNVYVFRGEYMWSVPGQDGTCQHFHVDNETLARCQAAKDPIRTLFGGR
jgi:hypothetical protein